MVFYGKIVSWPLKKPLYIYYIIVVLFIVSFAQFFECFLTVLYTRCVNSCYTSSVAAFKELFYSSTSHRNVAVLLRLCGRNPSHGGHNLSHQTTEDWRLHVLEMEGTVSKLFVINIGN